VAGDRLITQLGFARSEKFQVFRENMWTSQEETKTRIGVLVPRLDIHKARTETTPEEIKAKMNKNREKLKAVIRVGQKEMKAATSFILAELEETMKHWVPNVLVSLDRRTLGLQEEINGKITKTQSDLQEELQHKTQGTQVEREATNNLVESMRHGLEAKIGKAAPYLKRLVAGFPPRRPGFDPWSAEVGFVVDKVALGQVFSEYFGFPCQSSFDRIILHPHNHPGQVQ
jgi:hypothetical protein